MSIEKFVSDIYSYGFAMRLRAFPGGIETIVGQEKMLPIHEQIKGKSLREYVEDVVKAMKAQKLVATVSKRNGTAFSNPKDFTLELSTDEFNALTKPKGSDAINDTIAALGEVPTRSTGNHMNDFYVMQLNLANNEVTRKTNELESIKTKYETLKEQYNDLKRDHDTLDQKHALEREKDRVAAENTGVAIIRELKPELQGLMGIIGEKMGVKQPAISGPTADTSKPDSASISGVVLDYVTKMGEAQRTFAFEVFVRAFNLSDEDKAALLAQLREKTPGITDNLNESLKTLVNK